MGYLPKKVPTAGCLPEEVYWCIWPLRDGQSLILLLNLSGLPVAGVTAPEGEIIMTTKEKSPEENILPPFFCGWYLQGAPISCTSLSLP